MKLLMTLSIILNLLLAGGIGGYYAWRGEEMQWFLSDYNSRPANERELIRETIRIVGGTEEATEDLLQQLQIDEELRERFTNASTPEEVQELVTIALRRASQQIREQQEQANDAVSRSQIAARDHESVRDDLAQERKAIELKIEQFELDKQEWNDTFKRTDLERIAQGISDAKKPEDHAQQVYMLDALEQVVVWRKIDQEDWIEIFNQMSPEQQAAFNRARKMHYPQDPMGVSGAEPAPTEE